MLRELALAEQVLSALWKLIGHDVVTPIRRMTYADAMARYGTDKPDLRFGLELVDCTDFFADTPFRVFQAPYVGAVVMAGGASQPRRTLDAWQEFGFKATASTYLSRLEQEKGVRRDIDDNGDLLVRRMGKVDAERRPLIAALAKPSWLDPATRGPR